jgi:hypothetical protein
MGWGKKRIFRGEPACFDANRSNRIAAFSIAKGEGDFLRRSEMFFFRRPRNYFRRFAFNQI